MAKIRKMTPADRGSIYEILQQTDMFTMLEITVAMELIDIYLFTRDQQDYQVYVCETNEEGVAGYVCFGPTPATEGTYDLYWIAVSPSLQNQGIGKKLLHFVENEIQKKMGRLCIIETSSQEKYKPTQQFYLRNQYRLEAQIKDFYRSNDDRLIFVKRFENNKNMEDFRENGTLAETASR